MNAKTPPRVNPLLALANTMTPHPVDVEGLTVHIRPLKAGEVISLKESKKDSLDLLACCLVHEDGTPLFANGDGREMLSELPAAVMVALVTAMNDINGLEDEGNASRKADTVGSPSSLRSH